MGGGGGKQINCLEKKSTEIRIGCRRLKCRRGNSVQIQTEESDSEIKIRDPVHVICKCSTSKLKATKITLNIT